MKKSIKEALFIYSVGIVYFGAILSLYFSFLKFTPLIIFQVVGLIISFAGLFLWASGFFSLGKNFYILPKPIGHTTSGIYKIVSHPIYFGISLTFFGLSLAVGSGLGLFYSIIVLSIFNYLRAKREEKYLLKASKE